jgi:hypothetical protein
VILERHASQGKDVKGRQTGSLRKAEMIARTDITAVGQSTLGESVSLYQIFECSRERTGGIGARDAENRASQIYEQSNAG